MRKLISKHVLICSMLLILLPFFGHVSALEATPLQKQFADELTVLHEQYRFPGATAAYILPDGTTGVAAVGLADIEQGIPMRPDSRMLAASIGKTFVGATVLVLADEGRLSLDDSISTWLGEHSWFTRLPNHSEITLRHLLTHTSGIPNHVQEEPFVRAFQEENLSANHPPAPEQLIAYVLDQPALFKPGEGWYYSDTGYLLVGLVIENVTGRTFYEEISRRFLAPLHLDLTTPSNQLEIPGLASGYMDKTNDFGLPPRTTIRPGLMAWHPGIEGAGGGSASNPKDLVVWAKALFEGDAFHGEYISDLLNPVSISNDTPGVGYGVGVGIHRGGSHGPTYGHGGWIPGYSSSLRYYPAHRIAIAFQINTDIGIVDDSTPVIRDMESRLARMVIDSKSEASPRSSTLRSNISTEDGRGILAKESK